MQPLDFRPPLILQNCGCTFCGQCLIEVIDLYGQQEGAEPPEGPPQCPNCQTDVLEAEAMECRRNNKIINFLTAEDAQPLLHGSIESIPCPKHPTKIIDFFCKTCSASVCSKCIYDDHNGHSLMQVDEMSNSLKQNVIDLRKMIDNSNRLINENQALLGQVREELERLMELQLNNI